VPSPSRCLSAGDAFCFVRDLAVRPPTGAPRVGLELEWLTYSTTDRSRRVDLTQLTDALDALSGALPCGSRLTIEPGGQVEISTLPCASVADAIDAARTDTAVVRGALGDADIEIVGAGLDRCRPPTRVLDTPRYRAMEAYFDHAGPEGRTMMCNSASMQINIDFDGDPRDAWRAANLAAPLLGARFSEPSPNRLDLWSRIDRTRTAPVVGDDPGDAWATYALAARVMFIRQSDEDRVAVLDGTTFCEWIDRGHPLGWPTEADLTEHLTTLFPPVRPRGWLELRTIDALDDSLWPVAAETAVSMVLDGPTRRTVLEVACR
jgi:glutamate--cysteine ligase